MQQLYSSVSWCVKILQNLRAQRSKRSGVVYLNYHRISDFDGDNDLFSVTKKQFKDHVKFISRNFTNNSSSPIKVAFTFDDGYFEHLSYAVGLLEEYAIPSIYFISTDLLGSERRYLKKSDLRQFSKYNFANLGSHGHKHTLLTKLDSSQLKSDISLSKNIIEFECGRTIDLFAYPYGDYDERFFDILSACGFYNAFTTKFGINNITTHRYQIKRYNVLSTDNLRILEDKILGYWDWYPILETMIR